jgi:hypothetical protein
MAMLNDEIKGGLIDILKKFFASLFSSSVKKKIYIP